ncbi:MAG: segregation/condensation protein A [Rhodospirillales bacterium]|mgnify:CR=1 FL=1|jgi:segregation and condensation protein A|nr:segregation/condensation protein A [Rhodospirillales bacterium]MBT4041146.1 segregation/condensation protein A [Rhodospirillales bacterium]MBT4626734.1 segregation/condensation protein A [Rhodospirillales bacterium]MBT5353127.1 segregation/condensation protein A [Rhodospirillales bacterium]MBT5519578.1 segregation/condensation protein A [Rhodospirillales bacterium]
MTEPEITPEAPEGVKATMGMEFMDDEDPRDPRDAFMVDVDGYEGPLDVLLDLARRQKVDITQVSIVQLADQYLAFVTEARQRNLELAADYLVMAAWLAYLKSRLLLPDMEDEDQPSGAEMAAVLAFQLRRLEAMRNIGAKMLERDQLGRDFFARGAPEPFTVTRVSVLDADLHDLMRAYGDMRRRAIPDHMAIEPVKLHTVEQALARIHRMLGNTKEWSNLWEFLPENIKDPLQRRSAIASTFAATLELAREGKARIRQSGAFGPIFISGADEAENTSKTDDQTRDEES